MAAASAARILKSRNLGDERRYLMASATTIYGGTMVMLNSSGLLEPAAASASNLGCVGVAMSTVVGTGATDYVIVQEGEFLFDGDTLEQADVGSVVYADDDQTLDETQAANCPRAGVLTEYVSASAGWVAMGNALKA